MFLNVSVYEIYNQEDELFFGSFNIGSKKNCINPKECHWEKMIRLVRRNVIKKKKFVFLQFIFINEKLKKGQSLASNRKNRARAGRFVNSIV